MSILAQYNSEKVKHMQLRDSHCRDIDSIYNIYKWLNCEMYFYMAAFEMFVLVLRELI